MASRSKEGREWILPRVLKFFGISSPAVVVMALLSYLGYRGDPNAPIDPELARAKRLVGKVGELVRETKEAIAERRAAAAKGGAPAPAPAPATPTDKLAKVAKPPAWPDDGDDFAGPPPAAKPAPQPANDPPPPRRTEALPAKASKPAAEPPRPAPAKPAPPPAKRKSNFPDFYEPR